MFNVLSPELLFILALSLILGFEVMRKTSSAMHTPLSMGIISLSGIVLIAAIVFTSNADSILGKILGSLSVLISTMNITVSLKVTARMIQMLEGKTFRNKK